MLQGAIRRGDEELALRAAAEFDLSGYPYALWRRLRLIASEDVGLAWPAGPAVVRALYENWLDCHEHRRGSGSMFIAHATLLLARSRKSHEAAHALLALWSDTTPLEVPDWCLDRHTKRGRAMGRGAEHFRTVKLLLADPSTGELTEPADRYSERARKAREEPRLPRSPDPQMTLGDER